MKKGRKAFFGVSEGCAPVALTEKKWMVYNILYISLTIGMNRLNVVENTGN